MSDRRSARVSPSEVHERLAEHLLIDGYRLVLDAPLCVRAARLQPAGHR
jgi:hypothetical protein